MNDIFEKKFIENFPKRTWLHKLHIFLTCIWIINLFGSVLAGNKFNMIMHTICVFCWGINWYFSMSKYDKIVLEYQEKCDKELKDEEMKNAFNFGYYKK